MSGGRSITIRFNKKGTCSLCKQVRSLGPGGKVCGLCAVGLMAGKSEKEVAGENSKLPGVRPTK